MHNDSKMHRSHNGRKRMNKDRNSSGKTFYKATSAHTNYCTAKLIYNG